MNLNQLNDLFLKIHNSNLIDVVNYHVKHHPTNILLKYLKGDEIRSISFQLLNELLLQASINFQKQLQHPLEVNEKGFIPVCYLADSTIDYPINFLSLLKLNLVPIILSVKNSSNILVHLIQQSSSTILVYDDSTQQLAEECKKGIPNLTLINSFDINNYNELLNISHSSITPYTNLSNLCFVLHSSGTCSYPKLVYISDDYVFELMKRYLNEIDYNSFLGVGIMYAPLYHGLGLTNFIKSIFNLSTLVMININQMYSQQIIKEIEFYNANYLILLPFLIKQIIEYCNQNPSYWQVLLKLANIFTAGAILPNEVIQQCQANNLTITNCYGSTETGFLATSLISKNIHSFDHFHFFQHIQYRLIYHSNDIAQFLILKHDKGLASDLIEDNEEGYLLGDLIKVVTHNQEKNELIFKIIGRADDIIVHINGTKTNPNSIEAELNSNIFIKHSQIYGANQLYNCAIIELNDNNNPFEVIQQSIYKQIQNINKTIPSHSRIFKELVLILPSRYHKSFITTAKGNIIRKKNEVLFKEEIDHLYYQFTDNSNNSSVSVTLNNNDRNTIVTIQHKLQFYFKKITNKLIQLNDNFFNNGMDSLCVIKYKKFIIKEYNLNSLNVNTIYQNDTIQLLSINIFNVLNNVGNCNNDYDTLNEYQSQVNNLIKKYTIFPSNNKYINNQKETNKKKLNVLITGANGSLSNFLIQQLIKLSNIKKIYALVRGDTIGHSELKLKKSFEQRKIQLNQKEWKKIKVLNYNNNNAQFGLNDNEYQHLLNETNVIYHSGWKVNFLNQLSSFKECIESTVSLLNFCNKSKYYIDFHFISSIGALFPKIDLNNSANSLLIQKQNELNSKLMNLTYSNGYNLSKLVTENILLKWAGHYNLNISIHRIGQVSGDSINGIWNTSEYFPLLVKNIYTMKVAPETFMSINWIPVDYAAKALVEFQLSGSNKNKDDNIHYIMSPVTNSFSLILKLLRDCGFQFDIVRNQKFIDMLKKDEFQTTEPNPITSLASFFTIYSNSSSVDELIHLCSLQTFPYCHQSPEIDSILLFKYLEAW
ncbi:acetyl-CoA synthetase-like protein, partial [Neoconidiobolus thromboides FSU 785]